MPLIEWSEEYSVHISSIDSQHRKLFQMLNDLYEAMRSGKGNSAAPAVLRGLIAYTKEHFAEEERLMKSSNYPRYPEHKAEHDKLTAEVVRLVKEFDSGKTRLSVPLLEFLRTWLQSHIHGSDKQYSSHLQMAGVR
jgi:hemerythrin-like metal-binding protein